MERPRKQPAISTNIPCQKVLTLGQSAPGHAPENSPGGAGGAKESMEHGFKTGGNYRKRTYGKLRCLGISRIIYKKKKLGLNRDCALLWGEKK